jgi:hypothetical protein
MINTIRDFLYRFHVVVGTCWAMVWQPVKQPAAGFSAGRLHIWLHTRVPISPIYPEQQHQP